MKKTLALILTFIMVLALVPTVAFAEEPKTIYVDANNGNDSQEGVGTTSDKAYQSLDKAMEAANDGATIYLAAGTYCGNSANPSEEGKGAGKNLTFVGAGSDKTTWQIRATKKYGSDGWCDYSFKNSDNITFENMTVIGSVYSDTSIKNNDTQGLTYINHLTLKDCIFNGRADYWGYKTTTFEDVTFNAPGTEASGIKGVDYSLWTWTGTEYTFNNCTFNSAGKVINAYRGDGGSTAENPVVLNFNDCKVFSSDTNKSVLNIKDANNYYTVNISGTNTVEGLKPNKITCSRLFQVEGWANNYNLSGGEGNNKNCQATVTIDGQTVWTGGKMVGHAIDTENDKYTDGYKDKAFTVTPNVPGSFEVKCIHCGYTEISTGELSNEIKLTRTVRQNKNSNPVPEDAPNSNKYKVANSSGITVDYTATMDMTKLEWKVAGKDVKKIQEELGVEASSPWELLMALAQQIDDRTEVILTFKFDDKIDLKAFKAKYEAAVNAGKPTDVLMLTSDMFEIADGGVQFNTTNNTTNNTMTITCKWKKNAITDNSTITLKGCGLPVTNDWNGSKQINIENRGCVGGAVHIKYKNPGSDAKMKAETVVPYVAANIQEQNITPSLDTIQIPIVGGCAADNFTLYYGGGSSGDSSGGSSSGGGYYHPTTTPVPVIVIPPKTGDMTVWQSILHFLGIR